MRGLKLFLDMINFYPNMQILELGDINRELSSKISEKIKECGGDLKQFSFDKYIKGDIKIEPRSFEYIVIYNIFDIDLLELSYQALENSADLIILLDKTKDFDVWELKEQIEKKSFVAVNDIDILDDFYIINAKKMYMWARG